ncbi:hypothetical protein ACIOG4_27985 [Streptomyces microflavus]|uniref:hypothetical protein n=1 Tax=Streptomyces microflavus TaxID=1919 RepID=UPI003822CFF0
MSETITCDATRRGRTWVTHVARHGVYGQGRTLKAVRADTEQGLALVGVTAEVEITPTTPELEQLRSAEAARTEALTAAVLALSLRRVSLRDIAAATGETIRQVKLILTGGGKNPAHATAREAECTCVITCAEDPQSACSLSGERHVHPAIRDRPGAYGPCPEHPDAPGDL